MLIKLALNNIKEKKFQSILIILSILISTASISLFISLNEGIKAATIDQFASKNPLNQITARPNTEDASILGFITNENKITTETIEEIKTIEGIKEIYPEMQFNNFASVEASVLGFSLITDSMVFGIDQGFFENEVENFKTPETPNTPYPVIIPKQLLDIYNFTIAGPQGLPALKEENLKGKEIILYPNYSTFFPGLNSKTDEIKLEVVGFSDKANLVGITLPYETVKQLNQKYTSNKEEKFSQIYIITNSEEDTEKVANQLEQLGLSTQYLQKNIEGIQSKIKYFSITLGIISFIILFTTSIAILSSFLSSIAERVKQLSLFRAIGANKSHIMKIILSEALIIGLIGSSLGILLTSQISKIINSYTQTKLESLNIIPEEISLLNTKLILLSLVFGLGLTLISALIPAIKASRLSPIESLNK